MLIKFFSVRSLLIGLFFTHNISLEKKSKPSKSRLNLNGDMRRIVKDQGVLIKNHFKVLTTYFIQLFIKSFTLVFNFRSSQIKTKDRLTLFLMIQFAQKNIEIITEVYASLLKHKFAK